jgi:DeoR/GlpR family transcriptional regulator of sugar metabolism
MLAQERQNAILETLTQRGGVIKMAEIVSMFNVSNETARRDLETLQDQNLVKRVYGGAILTERRNPIDLTPQRVVDGTRGQAERAAIGKAAADLVNEGETVLLASGTTVLQVALNLKRLRSLTVLTNSLAVINALIDTNFDIYVLGGKLDMDELIMSGHMSLRAVQSVFVDKTFIGAGGITFMYGVSDYGSVDANIREEMINRANQVILVAQSEKFGRNAFSLGNPLDRIHTVVSDNNLSIEYINGIREMGIDLILAQS